MSVSCLTENETPAESSLGEIRLRARAEAAGCWFTEGFAPSAREAGHLPLCAVADTVEN